MAQANQSPHKVPTSDTSNVGTSNEGGYSERQFLIPLRDSHGHSERISLRVHPAYLPVLNTLMRSKKFPFRSTNDIVRFAIDRVCRDLERHADVPSLMRQIDTIKEVLAFEESNLDFLTTFESLTRVAQALINSNASHEASRIVAEMRHHIMAMPEGYWRGRYEQELLTRFGHLLRVTPGDGASLADGDHTEE